MICWCQLAELSVGPRVQQRDAQQIIKLTTLACWDTSLSIYCESVTLPRYFITA